MTSWDFKEFVETQKKKNLNYTHTKLIYMTAVNSWASYFP